MSWASSFGTTFAKVGLSSNLNCVFYIEDMDRQSWSRYGKLGSMKACKRLGS